MDFLNRFVQRLWQFIKDFALWLLLVAVIVVLLVSGVETLLYRSITPEDLPAWTPRFGGQELVCTESKWFVPLAGRYLGRTFAEEAQPAQPLPEVLASIPALDVPAAAKSSFTLRDADGTVLFEDTAQKFRDFSFETDGDYTATLVLESTDGFRQTNSAPTGHYTYDFKFTLRCRPQLTLSTDTAVQGSVVGVRLSGILGDIPPMIQCDLAPEATFTRQGQDWVCFLPVNYNQPGGEYLIKTKSGSETAEATVQVRGRSKVEIDSYTLDGTAAIPYIGKAPKKLEPLFSIADPDIYWNGAFTQPISGRVVRDYAVTEHIDRLDPVLLAEHPELALLNLFARSRRSTNVTMAVTPGRKVVAPAAGRVVFAGVMHGGGRTVVIEHGCALKSIVYLLGRIDVSEGDHVAQGDVIGTTQGHVCCEMRLYDVPISPWEVWRGHGGLFF